MRANCPAGSTLPHLYLWPTCSSSGWPPLIAVRYFSSGPSDSGSLRIPCPRGTSSKWLQVLLAVSSFRLRARLDFSIPSCSPGQRGITPAFGYSAPHPSAEGTSTPHDSCAAQRTRPDQRTAIKARGSYDPHYEAGQMTATTNCRNVEIVLAMWMSSSDAQV